MFTGIVTDIGQIAALTPQAEGKLHRLRRLGIVDVRNTAGVDHAGMLTPGRVSVVDLADTTRIVSGFLDEQLLLHFLPDQVLVVALSLEAEPLAPDREEWNVLESLLLVGGGGSRAQLRSFPVSAAVADRSGASVSPKSPSR